MIAYRQYIQHLKNLIANSDWGRKNKSKINLHLDLNGGAADALRNQVTLTSIKEFGAYFTGEKLGRDALHSASNLDYTQPIYDPACGAGDLLLRWAEHLPISKSLEETINHWETLIMGSDIHQEFVDVTKYRLVISAISRGAKLAGKKFRIEDRFQSIIQQDFLANNNTIPNSTIILNPPFNQTSQLAPVMWGKGKISQAAVFITKCIEQGTNGQRIIAILPDVLRSGTRYAKWRLWIERNLIAAKVTNAGRFNEFADVDVFILEGVVNNKANNSIKWSHTPISTDTRLDSICQIRVGSVVPHRDPMNGPLVPYFSVHDLPPWKHVSLGPMRRVSTTTLQPPFVVVRRTSSPSDKQRPVASIVNMKVPVALENHLIALLPLDGCITTCEKIMRILQSESTRNFIDQEIRCRHLTVKVLKQIIIT